MIALRVVQTGLLLGAAVWVMRVVPGLPWLWLPVVIGMLSLPAGLGTNAEIIYLPFVLAALGGALSRQWVLAGLCAALAVSVKYTVALDLVGVFLVFLALGGQGAGRLVLTALIGFALIQGGLYAYFLAHGVDLIQETVLRNFAHSVERASFYVPKTALAGIGLLGAVIAVRLVVQGRYGPRWLVLSLVAWTLLSLLQAQVTGQHYAHYFVPVFVPLSMLAFLDWPVGARGILRLGATALLVALPLGVVAGAGLTVLGDRTARETLAQLCPAEPFQYHGGYLAAYRVCDAPQPAQFFYPPFYADPHFIQVSGSGGRDWACGLERAILVETDTLPQRYANGAAWCAGGPPKAPPAFSGLRQAVRDLLGDR